MKATHGQRASNPIVLSTASTIRTLAITTTHSMKWKDRLAKLGWKDEGIAWYAEDETGIPVYRSYNPNAKAGAHHFTTSKNEQDYLTDKGWTDEGIAWYGMITDGAVRASEER